MFFEVSFGEGYEWVNPLNEDDCEIFSGFDGRPLKASWQPVAVHRVRADKRSKGIPSDFPCHGGGCNLILRKKAVDALRPMLEKYGEILPLKTDDGVELFVFNAWVIDALDKKKSVFTFFPGTKKVMRTDKTVFLEEPLRGVDLFKLPGGAIYVSENFIEAVKKAGLVGLEFIPYTDVKWGAGGFTVE